MESLGLNKLTVFQGRFFERKNKLKYRWETGNSKITAQKYIIFWVQVVSNKNNNILINTIENIENILWISLIFSESRQGFLLHIMVNHLTVNGESSFREALTMW